VESISGAISRAPSIAADVIRLSNSAAFVPGRRIQKISEAVVILGMNNISTILTTAAARRIIDRRYRRFEQVWEHCNRTAFYARNIAIDSGHSDLVDGAFIAALLHDIGKIVFLSTDMNLVNQIAGIVGNRKIRSTTIIEELFVGISHSALGALIAEKWNFPDELIEAIRYHHAPLDPAVKHRDLVMIVYLANQISNQEHRQLDIGFYETGVLERFGIGSRVELEAMAGRLRARYDRHAELLGRNAR
jgi:putative nucleotidyltransferase with HDIG domain